MINDSKEQENAGGEALREPGNAEKRGNKEKVRGSIIIDFNPVEPNNSDSLVVIKELEIEGREEQLLKQSLGIC